MRVIDGTWTEVPWLGTHEPGAGGQRVGAWLTPHGTEDINKQHGTGCLLQGRAGAGVDWRRWGLGHVGLVAQSFPNKAGNTT